MSWSIQKIGLIDDVQAEIAQIPTPTYDSKQYEAARQFILNELEEIKKLPSRSVNGVRVEAYGHTDGGQRHLRLDIQHVQIASSPAPSPSAPETPTSESPTLT